MGRREGGEGGRWREVEGSREWRQERGMEEGMEGGREGVRQRGRVGGEKYCSH